MSFDISWHGFLFFLSFRTVVAVASQPTFHDPNGNNDSGYAASNLEDTQTVHVTSPHHSPPRRAHTVPQFKVKFFGD